MSHLHETITLLEQELEVTEGRCHELERAIAAIRPLAGGVVFAKRAGKSKSANAGRRKARPAPVPRGLPDVSEQGAAIVSMLKKHGGVMKPGDLGRALKLEPATLRYQLKPLEKSKQVLVTGATAGRRISLPGAKEAP